MKSKKLRKLRPGEKVPKGMSFAKSVIAFARAITDKDGGQHKPAGRHWSERKRKKKREEKLYQRILTERARAEQAMRQQCEELLQRYRERMR